MPDRRSPGPQDCSKNDPGSVIALWLIPSPPVPLPGDWLSPEELICADGLAGRRADQYRFTRAWLRRCLSRHFDCEPGLIPLLAPPGQPPTLKRGWGFVSISHTHDALALGWSVLPIGIDLERSDRSFDALTLARRFFDCRDLDGLDSMPSEACRSEVLRQWLAKEAAIKWQRGSLARDLSAWSWSGNAVEAHHLEDDRQVRVRHHQWGDWLIAVASDVGQSGQGLQICLR